LILTLKFIDKRKDKNIIFFNIIYKLVKQLLEPRHHLKPLFFGYATDV